jgi:sec-independent protein translocase protein TatA
MLGLDNPIHIVFVLIVLLLVFGAKRLPEMGKSMGEGLRGFKESISGEHPHSGISVDHTEADHSPVRVDELTPATPAPTTAETADRTPVHAA